MVKIKRLNGAHVADESLAARLLRLIEAIEVNGDIQNVQSDSDASED